MTKTRGSQTVEVKKPDLEVHRPDLSRLFVGLGAKPQDIEDLVQQTFMKVLGAIRAGKLIVNMGGYCFRVGTHVYHSNRRRQRASEVQVDSALLENATEQTPEPWRNEPQAVALAVEEIRVLDQESKDALGEDGSLVLQLLSEGFDDEEELAKEVGVSKYRIRRLKTKINKWFANREGS